MEQSEQEKALTTLIDNRITAHIDAYHKVNEEALNVILKIVEQDRETIKKLRNELELANRRIYTVASKTHTTLD